MWERPCRSAQRSTISVQRRAGAKGNTAEGDTPCWPGKACGDHLGRKPIMGKPAKSKLNLLCCRELILTLDINLFNRDITPLSSMLLIQPESRAPLSTGWMWSCRNPYADIVFPLALLKISVWSGLSLPTAHLRSLRSA